MAQNVVSRRRVLAIALAITCPAEAADPLPVVASFSILGDLVRQVGGARVRVTSLVGPDQDLHAFQPRPSDVRVIAAARVVVINGLGLEEWAERLARSAGFTGTAVVATRDVQALRSGASHTGHDHGGLGHGGDAHRAFDPHAWQEVANVKQYIANIRDGLSAADPANTASYAADAAAYLTRLDALDTEIRGAWAPIPRAARRIVTSHDAFVYYGDAYQVDFKAPQSPLATSEPTPREMATLIAQIRAEKIRALFLENISPGQVLNQISRETGVRIGGRVYSDALSQPNGPAPTYIDMMRHNTRLFTEALR